MKTPDGLEMVRVLVIAYGKRGLRELPTQAITTDFSKGMLEACEDELIEDAMNYSLKKSVALVLAEANKKWTA